MMINLQIIETVAKNNFDKMLKGLRYERRPYPGVMPEGLNFWSVWLSDCGHNILSIPHFFEEKAFQSGDPSQFAVPMAVKTVLRGYRWRDGYVIATTDKISYSRQLGLMSPSEDNEF